MIALGVDIGGTSVKAALLESSRVVAHAQSPPYSRASADEIAAAVRAACEALGARRRSASVIGLCVPGVRDPATGTVLNSVNAPGLVGVNPEALVRSAVGAAPSARVYAVSDAAAAAYSVWCDSRPPGRLFAVSLGTGVGACVLDEGVPLRVTGLSSGHFGQIDVTLSEDPGAVPADADGARGTLESYLGLPALRARYGPALGAWLDAPDPDSPPIRALVRGLRTAHAIYRPDAVALLGGVGIRLGPVADFIRAAVQRDATSLIRPHWRLIIGRSLFHAAEGAARLAEAANAR